MARCYAVVGVIGRIKKNWSYQLKMRIAFVVKLLIWITIGPLILGFLSPIFWTEHSEFSEKQKRILELIAVQDYHTSFFPLRENLKKPSIGNEDSECKSTARLARQTASYSIALREKTEQLDLIYDAAQTAEIRYIDSNVTQLRQKMLSPLPSPLIGMIDACIHATVLSPICEMGLKAKLNSVSVKEMEEVKSLSLKAVQPLWCMTSETMLRETGIDSKTIHWVPSATKQ
jgi:hypothetical protein